MTVFKIILKNNAKGNFYKEELIFFSFKFLLAREKNTLILSKFNLETIQNYFPEYKNEIKNWLNL